MSEYITVSIQVCYKISNTEDHSTFPNFPVALEYHNVMLQTPHTYV